MAGHLRQDLTIRWWHPGAWWALILALGRNAAIVPSLCPTCRGAGRLLKKDRFLRRMACPACRGTGRDKDDDSMATVISGRVRQLAGLSTRQAVQDSVAASPAGAHELYPKGSIVICVSCAAPIYRLERSLFIGERAGRSASGLYKPVRVADLLELRRREDIDAGVRAALTEKTGAELKAHCDRIPELKAGDTMVCPACTRPFVAMRTSEANETLEQGYVLELLTIPPKGHAVVTLRKGKVHARRLAGITR